jgi:DNA-nicking Smr family endonuclease
MIFHRDHIAYDEHTVGEEIYEIDLHGIIMSEAKMVLDEVFEYIKTESSILELHVVVGQGKGSESGPVLPAFVGNYVKEKGFSYKIEHGKVVIHL